ncbi:Thioesterase domain-containing protein [Streptomyces sp. DvalAA-14]|uniref:alpha/beta fold hydrolase n=1 Tax=unclassified Streptomyces TaxID=2593676 RepID=UPI00081BBBA7|nr:MULTISPECIES: alpha/beta fold hydrolase [unclassified Streptomyces]MYS21747.1 alpha/beta fold hydrolase [Streptomyces sp. SID4948]SCE00422.1 Thioesterase domain-containing protein [Streptomyces sp. DvalAA-14]
MENSHGDGQAGGLATPLLIPLGRRPGPLRTVFFHALGGGMIPYLGLVAHLARKGPVHGIRALGLEPGEDPDASVPAMADRYAALLSTLPSPPDLLVGWSMGGLLAYETAQRLPAGRPPDLLLIDSSPAPRDGTPATYGAVRTRVLRDAAAQLDPADLPRTRRTVDAHLAARRRHSATAPYNGRALLVPCTHGDDPHQADNWARLVDDLTVRPLATDHFGALRSPHLATLTAFLGEFLASCPAIGGR